MIKLFSRASILLICLSLLFTGCAKTNEPSNAVPSDVSSEAEGRQTENKEGERKRMRPDMFGRVKSIIGNEVVLEIAEMPERTANKNGDQTNKPIGVPNGEGNGGGQRPQGVGAGRELKFTGETATLLIPIGVPITTRGQGELKEIDLADIYAGALLQIWFDDINKEDKMITRVMMQQGR